MTYSAAGKEMLIDQLRAVFVARGYDGATLVHLANAAGLSKASLYHHFPGGKPEMAATLVRHAIADLQRSAFSRLSGSLPPAERLEAFIDGFVVYTDGGQTDCLLAVFSHHATAGEDTEAMRATIAQQFADWHATVVAVLEALGVKPKKAHHQAYDLVAALYGALLSAKMHNQPALFTQAVKRIKKNLRRLA